MIRPFHPKNKSLMLIPPEEMKDRRKEGQNKTTECEGGKPPPKSEMDMEDHASRERKPDAHNKSVRQHHHQGRAGPMRITLDFFAKKEEAKER